MAKNATIWYPASGQGDANTDNYGDLLLLETGDYLLLETGDNLVVEDITIEEKAATAWSDE